MALYVLYRLGTVIYTFSFAQNPIEYIVLLIFVFSEFFILINGVFYFFNVIFSRLVYRRQAEIKHSTHHHTKPEVIVFLPMINEPLEVIEKTFRAAHLIDYESKRIVVIDSSEDKEYQASVGKLCKLYSLEHFITPYPRHGAKAGAMNEAMIVYKAPYYAVFDADYRASPDFLRILVPMMEAEKDVAFIQTPQFYGNHVKYPVSRIAQIQQSIFYEYICEGKSVHDAVFSCGTNLIIRQKALEDVGFYDEESVTEDFATSIRLVIHGWKARYYNFTTAFGDGPVNLKQFFKQQYRWSRGTFGAFFKNAGALWDFKRPIAFWQRIEYTLSGTYFFVGVIWSILLMMPIIYIFFRVPGYRTDPLLFTVVYLPYFLLSFAFYGVTMRSRGYRFVDLLRAQSLTFLTLPIYAKAFFHALVNKKAKFERVKKDDTPFSIPFSMMRVQIAFIILNFAGVVYGLWSLPDTINEYALMTNTFWAFFHFSLMSYLLVDLYVQSIPTRD